MLILFVQYLFVTLNAAEKDQKIRDHSFRQSKWLNWLFSGLLRHRHTKTKKSNKSLILI